MDCISQLEQYLPDGYFRVIAVVCLIAFQCFLTGFIAVGPTRKRIFTPEFLKENFEEEHKKAFGTTDVPKLGYPDTGSGRYSQKLSYKDWFELNNAQRVHYNFLEAVGVIIPLLLVAGLEYTNAVAIIGLAYSLFRLIYSITYLKKGPNARLFGATGAHLIPIILFVLAIKVCFCYSKTLQTKE